MSGKANIEETIRSRKEVDVHAKNIVASKLKVADLEQSRREEDLPKVADLGPVRRLISLNLFDQTSTSTYFIYVVS